MNFLKKEIKKILMNRQHRKYAKRISEKKRSYQEWIEQQEKKIKTEYETEKISGEVLTYFYLNLSECRGTDFLSVIEKSETDILILGISEGKLSEKCIPLILQEFNANKNLVMAYGDEDVLENGIRRSPWFKPDWSPDTFLSGFYFGSLIAIKNDKFHDVIKNYNADNNTQSNRNEIFVIYSLIKDLLEKEHCFTVRKESDIKVSHISEILIHTKREGYEQIKDWKLPIIGWGSSLKNRDNNQNDYNHMISVIIPSKDNPQVLFNCINSFLKITDSKFPYEIIIIDNGSREENRQIILREIDVCHIQTPGDKGFRGIRYYYEPMDFNFSHMCNLGAENAKGDLLLFLNDDMEILSHDWLTLLAEKALLPYAGAVGAKLLYPDSDIIQHAGITNLRVGPAHKLQYLSDENDYYYGRNRGVYNMIAVTGACLMVRTEIFYQVDGFSKELAVAFNDVDLCYRIYEKGYYNIQRNDVKLYHHESLSRGKDGASEEKQCRLLREKDILYKKHQNLYARDPFYHKYLITDMLAAEYEPAFYYEATLNMPWAKVKTMERLPDDIKQDRCVMIGVETAMDICKWKYGVDPKRGESTENPEECGFYFQGYSFVIGADNACYKRTLLLQNKTTKAIICIPVEDEYRQDIKKNVSDQLNVALTGFAARVKAGNIPSGSFRLGVMAEDRCSRQKLINWSNWLFVNNN